MMNDEFIIELLKSFAAYLTQLVSKLNLKVFLRLVTFDQEHDPQPRVNQYILHLILILAAAEPGRS